MRFAGHNFKKSRSKGDFYETPEIAVEKLLEKEPFAGEVWDPASGGGAICRVLEKHGFKVIGSDIREDKKVWGDNRRGLSSVTRDLRERHRESAFQTGSGICITRD